MRQPEPNRDSEAFLSALADELLSLPDEATTIRHVGAAASAARKARVARRSHALRLGAATLAVITLLGTGGVTAAGALPAPLQSAVADLARVMPVPIRVPYPTVAAEVVDARGREIGLAGVRRAEEVMRPHEPGPMVTTPAPVEPVTASGSGPSELDEDESDGAEQCDAGHREDRGDEDDGHDDDEHDDEEMRARIGDECGGESVDRHRFEGSERGDDESDREEDGGDDDRSSDDHEEGGERRDEGDGWSGSWDRGEWEDGNDDREEESRGD